MRKSACGNRHRGRHALGIPVALVISALSLALASCTSSGANGSVDSPSSVKHPPTSTTPTSSKHPPSAAQTVEANKAQVATRLAKHATVHVVVPPADENNGKTTTYEIQPAGSGVVTAVSGFAGYFEAMKDGTVTIVAEQSPPCSTGATCASAKTEIGAVVITVTG